jgi:hypothetical protein
MVMMVTMMMVMMMMMMTTTMMHAHGACTYHAHDEPGIVAAATFT